MATKPTVSAALKIANEQIETLNLTIEVQRAQIAALMEEVETLRAAKPAAPAPRPERPAPYQPGEVISTYPARRSSTGWEAKVQSAKPNVTSPVAVTEAFARSFTKGTRGVFLVPEQRVATPAPAASRARTMSPEEAASYAQYAY